MPFALNPMIFALYQFLFPCFFNQPYSLPSNRVGSSSSKILLTNFFTTLGPISFILFGVVLLPTISIDSTSSLLTVSFPHSSISASTPKQSVTIDINTIFSSFVSSIVHPSTIHS
ncbi:hypothetical protein AN161_22525 [Lysinibacillus sp. FJAT-14222]|nr:hypothetical protein AN161_22525 [Lysinibacillus sp. FJAT-14222]